LRRGFREFGGQPFGFEALEVLEAAAESALGSIHAALEALEESVVHAIRFAQRPFHRLGHSCFIHPRGPNPRFDAAQPQELPDGGDEGIEQVAFFGSHDSRLGVDAGFERVKTGGGLALSGARAGGFFCIQAIGLSVAIE